MITKAADLKKLEEQYEQAGNQLVMLYGRKDCKKEDLIRLFVQDKKYFYYRCRQTSAEEQLRMMGEELGRQFEVSLQKHTYDEYFNRIKSGDPSKLVVVIDEVQYVMKKDPEFFKSILKLKGKRLYPGPVLIVLASSSIVWVEQDLDELLQGEAKKFNSYIKIEDLNFLEVVRAFPKLSVSECIKAYGCIGGVPGYMQMWDENVSFKENICRLVLDENGPLFDAAQQLIASELRELSVYNTILSAIARGKNKLNDLFLDTGYSRAKISVYMKNLSHFDIVEKVVSFESGGWNETKKGIYQIKDTFIKFWYQFVFPNKSMLFRMSTEEFYEKYIEEEIEDYLADTFTKVCTEYMKLQNQVGKLPLKITKMGKWIGKTGTIDFVLQNDIRENIVGICNWKQETFEMERFEQLQELVKKSRIKPSYYFLFSAKKFAQDVIELAENNEQIVLVDMLEL